MLTGTNFYKFERFLKRLIKRRTAREYVSATNVVFHQTIETAQKIFTYDGSWEAIEPRLLSISVDDQKGLRSFVIHALTHTRHIATLINLARSELSRDIVGEYLESADFGEDGPFWKPMLASQRFCAGLLTASALVLARDKAESILSIVKTIHAKPNNFYAAMIDSAGSVLVEPPADDFWRGLMASRFKDRRHHRLVITPSIKDIQSISILFSGADKVTVIAPTELMERTNFNQVQLHSKPDQIQIEHPRSRITRFSTDYHHLHTITAAVATRAIGQIDDEFEGIWGAARPHAELWLSDEIFFPTLKLASIRKLLECTEFDHVVVAVDGSRDSDTLCEMLGAIEGFGADERVEVVSMATTERDRLLFPSQISKILGGGKHVATGKGHNLTPITIRKRLEEDSRRAIENYSVFNDSVTPRILYGASFERLYNAASVSFFEMLQRHYQSIFALITHDKAAFVEGVGQAYERIENFVQVVPAGSKSQDLDLTNRLSAILAEVETHQDTPTTVASLLRARPAHFPSSSLQGYLKLWMTIQQWFQRMEETNSLPSAVLVSPVRNARTMLIAAAAREKCVPSISLEPHVQRTTYCRYGRALTDYYGVMSSYFRDVADGDGRIADERCRVVGSPRIIGQSQYDLSAQTIKAREVLRDIYNVNFEGYRQTISFFSQPSKWEQIAAVWEIIIRATEGLDTQIFLKGHPEESSARMSMYMAIAEKLGAQDRVVQFESNVIDIMEASDMVLSCYSTTILEAVLLRRPAAGVTNGDTEYPLEMHKVAGVPLYRDVVSLRSVIAALGDKHAEWQQRISEFLTQESQFIDGPEPRLKALVDEVTNLPSSQSVRPKSQFPTSIFLSGPHQVYDI